MYFDDFHSTPHSLTPSQSVQKLPKWDTECFNWHLISQTHTPISPLRLLYSCKTKNLLCQKEIQIHYLNYLLSCFLRRLYSIVWWDSQFLAEFSGTLVFKFLVRTPRLDFIMEANTMNSDQTAHLDLIHIPTKFHENIRVPAQFRTTNQQSVRAL